MSQNGDKFNGSVMDDEVPQGLPMMKMDSDQLPSHQMNQMAAQKFMSFGPPANMYEYQRHQQQQHAPAHQPPHNRMDMLPFKNLQEEQLQQQAMMMRTGSGMSGKRRKNLKLDVDRANGIE
jgi:hypothetical protein